ncbi:hypothetical protein BJY01DRAFT_250353 [Aspergillus pseudoustus]|uniref:Uncharacterized protein n=1 Tax=Aspergillus pseudoustus TaxID=1810923 RepID=A0ABR4JI91_9EURO
MPCHHSQSKLTTCHAHPQVQGWIDMSTSETMIRVELAGHDLGVFHGMANKALRINLRLQFVHGTVILELNPFDELWLHVDTVRADKKERFSIFDCKKSELLQRCSGVSCETWV